MATDVPIVPLIEVTRGSIVESGHHGLISVVDLRQDLAISVSADHLVYPRSTLKPFQLEAFVNAGAEAAFNLSTQDLAVMTASHQGSARHQKAVHSLLRRFGAEPAMLVCGGPPGNDSDDARLSAECSGKHAAMIGLARLLGVDAAGYESPSHPVQVEIRRTIAHRFGLQESALLIAVDGCSVPTYGVTTGTMARAFAELASSAASTPLGRIGRAMRRHSELVGGGGCQIDTELMRSGRSLVAKAGAEGLLGIGHESGIGLIIKMWDGDPGGRARRVAAHALIGALGWPVPITMPAADAVLNQADRVVGKIRPTSQFIRLLSSLEAQLGARPSPRINH